MSKIQEIIGEFSGLETQERLEVLMEFAEEFPDLPEKFQELRDAGLNRIEECQTPVFMWIELENGIVKIYADVAQEAPTVRGFVSILLQAFDGASPQEILDSPNNLLHELGLAQILGMMRMQGLTWVLHRIKKEVTRLISEQS